MHLSPPRTTSALRRRLVALAGCVATVAGLSVAAVGAGVGLASPAAALDNGLALTPPMGFNDWNAFGCNVSEQLIEQTADFFVSSGLKAAGYKYVNIDDCWLEKSRSASGHLVPDPTKFPDGIKGTADYVHSKGLKLGIYEDAGTKTCAGYPGSLGHEQTDANDFAAWGVDYLKYDNCNNQSDGSLADYKARYKAMRDALANTGRKIVFSMCEWGTNHPATWAANYANLWRTTGDISDNWNSLKSIIAQNVKLAPHAHPGAWNDPDMLEIGNGGMTDTEYKTHFSMWAEMAAPLLIGTDLRKASAETLKILKNTDVIKVDQDPLGVQGQVIAHQHGGLVLSKPLANGDRAVALYNPSDVAQPMSTTAALVGLPRAHSYRMQDLWSGNSTETAGTIAASVPAHGTALYRVSTRGNTAALAPATALSLHSTSAYGGADATAESGGTVRLSSTVSDYGRAKLTDVRVTADAPDGWQLDPVTDWTARKLATNASLVTRWKLTAPDSVAPGTYPVQFTASYRYGKKVGQLTDRATVQILAPPPSGTTALSDVTWASATNDWGPVEKDSSNGESGAGDGHTITINGTTYAKGLGTNAPSDIVYYLGGHCTSLKTDVGIDDEKDGSDANATFQIFGDNTKLADSGAMTPADPAKSLTADLTGVNWLRLHADDNGSADSDHTDWAGPELSCATSP